MGTETADQTKPAGDAQAPFMSNAVGLSENSVDPDASVAQLSDGHSFDASIYAYNYLETATNNVVQKSVVDHSAPFESVKEVVSKYGEIVDWKAQKNQKSERRKYVELELEKVYEGVPQYQKIFEATKSQKVQAVEELASTKKLIAKLNLKLEKALMEENQAKQDSELAHLRVKKLEQGLADEAIIAAKAQTEVSEARYNAAVKDLELVKSELKALRRECIALSDEITFAVNGAEEAVAASMEVEKTVAELTLELKMAKESLESAHAAHLEVEEKRIAASMAKEQDELNWGIELEAAEKEVKKLNEQLESMKQTKSKLDACAQLLFNLRLELSTHMRPSSHMVKDGNERADNIKKMDESGCNQQNSLNLVRKELEEAKINIDMATQDLRYLRVAAVSLKSELEREKDELTYTKKRQEMTSTAFASLEVELANTFTELETIQTSEIERRAELEKLAATIQQATQETDQEKSAIKLAQKEYRKLKEEAELVKAELNTAKSRLNAALKEIEASKASEKLALAAIKAMEGSQSGAKLGSESEVATLTLEEYWTLSKQACEAEQAANMRMSSVVSHVELSKESEARSLEKLEEVVKERDERKESLRIAIENAEKYWEGKLGAEHELRMWRAKNEQSKSASESRSSSSSFEGKREHNSFDSSELSAIRAQQQFRDHKFFSFRRDADTVVSDSRSKKKHQFFPRIVMFLAKRKAHSELA